MCFDKIIINCQSESIKNANKAGGDRIKSIVPETSMGIP